MKDISPTQIIILGGSGDLSQRKLLPALLDLFSRGMLPDTFSIVGLASSPRTDEEYREFVKKSIQTHHSEHDHTSETITEFCNTISYVKGSFDDLETYTKLGKEITKFNNNIGKPSNRLFYLAVPPKYYGQIFRDLKESGLTDETDHTWTHILVEKPFGNNLETAQSLDAQLAELYREDQIFRIDHYLAKEAVQNILSFRFANRILQAPWNRDSIKSVTITMTETIDVGDRANFYEGIGALRDVGQNHLLQLVALTAMREPAEFTAEAIRSARTEALQALVPIDTSKLSTSVLRGQYEEYKNNDTTLNSEIETYFELKTELSLPEWEGVPFYIRSGKALDNAEVSISVQFKDVASGMFETKTCLGVGNIITLHISPEQTISIKLNAKGPGLGYKLETRTLNFTCDKDDLEIKNSYEKVLYDSITGDCTLFTRTEEVLAAWKYISPIIEAWEDQPLYLYKKGSKGPYQTIIE
ncbi:MAG: glucose-6-phosphate 1-dehydrogenase [Candidatus Paceibacteria bacterium]|jgi:glucose-6-phosphate 1-dehydrogenase